MKISGINSFYYYEYNNKKYFFFGDLHNYNDGCDIPCDYYNYTFTKTLSYNNNCSDIGPLLHNWLLYNNQNNIKTDFYIEDSFTKSNVDRRTFFKELMIYRHHTNYNTLSTNFPWKMSYLELLSHQLQPCLIKDKTNCPYYPNVHVHYADIRAIDDIRVSPYRLTFLENATKSDIINVIKTLVYNDIILGVLDYRYYNTMIKILKSIKLSSSTKLLYDVLLDKMNELTVIRNIDGKDIKMHRVAWSLYNHQDIKDFIYKLYKHELEKINFIEDVKQINDVQDLEIFLLKYTNIFTIISAYIMDAYVLSRMFNQDGEEIIVYAGASHIEVYDLYFRQLGLEAIYNVSVQEKKCIAVPNNISVLMYHNKL